MPDYPVYAKLSNQKLSQLAVDPVEIDPEIKSFPFSYINPAWDYAKIFAMLMELQHQIAMTMAFTTSQEVATPHSHANLGMRLEYLATTLRSIQDKLNQPG